LITIIGNTDNTGNEEKNRILSEARAKAVAEYLTSKNIDKSRIKYTGYGSSKPIASNDTEEGKQQNRRVEFIISSR
jgi:outer membrane protein OmpA-like peptidoglycan-associated protein